MDSVISGYKGVIFWGLTESAHNISWNDNVSE
jgi:hypothetical protein